MNNMSWFSKLLKKKTGVPEIKIPFGEALILPRIAENLEFLSLNDLEMLRDLVAVAIHNRKAKQ